MFIDKRDTYEITSELRLKKLKEFRRDVKAFYRKQLWQQAHISVYVPDVIERTRKRYWKEKNKKEIYPYKFKMYVRVDTDYLPKAEQVTNALKSCCPKRFSPFWKQVKLKKFLVLHIKNVVGKNKDMRAIARMEWAVDVWYREFCRVWNKEYKKHNIKERFLNTGYNKATTKKNAYRNVIKTWVNLFQNEFLVFEKDIDEQFKLQVLY